MICNRSFIIRSQNTGEYVNMVQHVIQYNIIEKNCKIQLRHQIGAPSSSLLTSIAELILPFL